MDKDDEERSQKMIEDQIARAMAAKTEDEVRYLSSLVPRPICQNVFPPPTNRPGNEASISQENCRVLSDVYPSSLSLSMCIQNCRGQRKARKVF